MRLRIVKYMSFLLCVGITAFSGAQIACAQDFLSRQDIIQQYFLEYHQLSRTIQGNQTLRAQSEKAIDNKQDELRKKTVSQLNSEGVEAYDVNPSSFNEVESKLNTNLEEIHLSIRSL